MNYQVEHFGLAAKNPGELKKWYERVLEGKVRLQTETAIFVELAGGLVLEIYQGQAASPETARNSLAGWRHLALRVAAVPAARAELEGRGIVFQETPKPAGGGGTVLFFQDPEGNLLHLVERPENFGF